MITYTYLDTLTQHLEPIFKGVVIQIICIALEFVLRAKVFNQLFKNCVAWVQN